MAYVYPPDHASPVKVYQPQLPRGRGWEVGPGNLELVVREFCNLVPLPVLTTLSQGKSSALGVGMDSTSDGVQKCNLSRVFCLPTGHGMYLTRYQAERGWGDGSKGKTFTMHV